MSAAGAPPTQSVFQHWLNSRSRLAGRRRAQDPKNNILQSASGAGNTFLNMRNESALVPGRETAVGTTLLQVQSRRRCLNLVNGLASLERAVGPMAGSKQEKGSS